MRHSEPHPEGITVEDYIVLLQALPPKLQLFHNGGGDYGGYVPLAPPRMGKIYPNPDWGDEYTPPYVDSQEKSVRESPVPIESQMVVVCGVCWDWGRGSY